MADEQNPNTAEATPSAAPAPQPAAPMITPEIQALIDQAKASAYNAGAKTTREAFEAKLKAAGSKQPAEPAPTAAPQPASTTTDVTAQLGRMRAFDRALARFDLSDSARDLIEADFNLASPPDPSAWVQARSEAYGWRRLGGTSTAPVTPTAAPTAPAPAQSMPAAAPPATPTLTSDTPLISILRQDPAAIEALAARDPAAFVQRLRQEYRGIRVPLRR